MYVQHNPSNLLFESELIFFCIYVRLDLKVLIRVGGGVLLIEKYLGYKKLSKEPKKCHSNHLFRYSFADYFDI